MTDTKQGAAMQPKVRTCLAFKDQAEEAARFYVSVIPDSIFEGAFRREPNGPAIMVSFTLAGTPYQALNMGRETIHNEAFSISVMTKDQRETDEIWEKLLANGGAAIQCSWLKDRFGICWQIVPEALPRMLMDEDRAAAERAFQAMLGMVKIDVAALEKAFAGR
jgi:predicted 3-demethylubiquinone-9 3-methyltransferase (glyoxalase superfamily)